MYSENKHITSTKTDIYRKKNVMKVAPLKARLQIADTYWKPANRIGTTCKNLQ